jgi:hypothetical protein
MRHTIRLSVGLFAAVVITVGFLPGASAAPPSRTAPAKPLPWDVSGLPAGADRRADMHLPTDTRESAHVR